MINLQFALKIQILMCANESVLRLACKHELQEVPKHATKVAQPHTVDRNRLIDTFQLSSLLFP